MTLDEIRSKIDSLDRQIADLVRDRFELARVAAVAKGSTLRNSAREFEVVAAFVEVVGSPGERVIRAIVEASVDVQRGAPWKKKSESST